ncbi:hypothetical protein P7K49_013388 [Saguinus oedipus]|uniref:Uncharacterized protein n=1 Tax=Saguinus oedipus TaxID=9490 RepID=A0ABQ9VFW1_SAGOE|nr:hypothetical protein P7K49_013388 [Saguinus oedipus]
MGAGGDQRAAVASGLGTPRLGSCAMCPKQDALMNVKETGSGLVHFGLAQGVCTEQPPPRNPRMVEPYDRHSLSKSMSDCSRMCRCGGLYDLCLQMQVKGTERGVSA